MRVRHRVAWQVNAAAAIAIHVAGVGNLIPLLSVES
jgi:hypothetical protein